MDYELFLGDSAKVLQSFEAESVDLTVTSPPYDNLRSYDGYTGFDFETIAQQIYRVTKPGGVVVWVVSDATVNGSETGTSFRQALYFMGCGFNLHDTMIWNKGSFTSPQENRYPNAFEFMFIFSKGMVGCNQIKDRPNKKAGTSSIRTIRKPDGITQNMYADKRKTTICDNGVRFNVWDIFPEQSSTNRLHPAPFPEALARDHILSWSNPGDLVLDPFLGSGTSGKMAIKYQRRFVGIEISQKYLDIAEKRIAAVTKQPILPGVFDA
jgi:DNA modification methylase